MKTRTETIIVKTDPRDNSERGEAVPGRFSVPNSWLWQGEWKGTDHYVDSAGRDIYVTERQVR